MSIQFSTPSNTALAVGSNIDYVLIKTFNQYTKKPVNLVLAKSLISSIFKGNYFPVDKEADVLFNEANKKIPYFVLRGFIGKDLIGLKYEQLLPFTIPCENPENALV